MRHLTAMAVGIGIGLVPALAARAELSASVAVTTDYVWRGVSQTDEGPALQVGAEYAHESGLYAGVWGSNVDFDEDDVGDPAHVEVDLYAGWRGETGWGLGWDLSVLRYMYPDTTVEYDYNELTAGLSYGVFTAEVSYSSDAFATGENALYYNVGASYEVPELFTVAASVGYSDLRHTVDGEDLPDSYVDWRVGVSREIWGLDFDLSYYDTSEDGERLYGDPADARVVLTVSKSF